MNRRNAMLTLSGAATAVLLTAGRNQASAQVPTPSPLTVPEYRTMTLMAGTLSKQQSELALQRAQHPLVKQFAQFEYNEQTAVAQVLTDLPEPPPAPLDAQHAALLQQLQAVSGPGFDRAYVLAQLQGHQELLQIQQGFLSQATADRDVQHIAVLARTSIMMHLTMLQDMHTRMPG